MKNSKLQQLLSTYPADLDIKLLLPNGKVIDFTGETLVHTSETAMVDENDKVDLGSGKQYILLNSIVY